MIARYLGSVSRRAKLIAAVMLLSGAAAAYGQDGTCCGIGGTWTYNLLITKGAKGEEKKLLVTLPGSCIVGPLEVYEPDTGLSLFTLKPGESVPDGCVTSRLVDWVNHQRAERLK